MSRHLLLHFPLPWRSGILPGWTRCLKPCGADVSTYNKVERSLIFHSWRGRYQGLCLERKTTFQNLTAGLFIWLASKAPGVLWLYTGSTSLYVNQNLQVLPALCNVDLPHFYSLKGSFTDSSVFHSGSFRVIKVSRIEKVSDTLKNPTLFLLILQLVCLRSLPYTFSPSTSVACFFAQSSHISFFPAGRGNSLSPNISFLFIFLAKYFPLIYLARASLRRKYLMHF